MELKENSHNTQPGEVTRKDNEELQQPERHEVERKADPNKEVTNKKENEVEQPQVTEHRTTLNNLDAEFQANKHKRNTGRMLRHETGTENNL